MTEPNPTDRDNRGRFASSGPGGPGRRGHRAVSVEPAHPWPRLSAGRYRSTPHRVHPPTGGGRISAPLFLDPSWDAHVPGIDGTYGDHLLAKVSRVFPSLRAATF